MNHVNIDFNRQTGKIKPMHGVNNGPITNMFTCYATEYFRDAGIVYSRLHDTEYPFGSEKLSISTASSRILMPMPKI